MNEYGISKFAQAPSTANAVPLPLGGRHWLVGSTVGFGCPLFLRVAEVAKRRHGSE